MSIIALFFKSILLIIEVLVFIIIPGFSLRNGNPWVIIPSFIAALIYFSLTIESTIREFEAIKSNFILVYQEVTENRQSQTNTTEWNPRIYSGDRSYNMLPNKTIQDNYTHLNWQNQGSTQGMNWYDAKKYCEKLNFRLPTIKELSYIVNRNRDHPAVNTEYFNITNNTYWSSTPLERNASYYWTVTFENGSERWNLKTENSYVLCVREG